MIDHLRLIDLMADAYTTGHIFTYETDFLHATLTQIEGHPIVDFRGSLSADDWFEDFFVLPHGMKDHPELGPMHQGFLEAVEDVISAIMKDLQGSSPIFCGHSLGGAQAVVAAALSVVMGHTPQAIVTCGAPHAGGTRLVQVCSVIPERTQYHHGPVSGGDPVTRVPPLPPLDQHIVPLTFVGVTDPEPDSIFRWHSLNPEPGYRSAVATYLAAHP